MLCVVRGRRVFVANVGDSRAIAVCRGGGGGGASAGAAPAPAPAFTAQPISEDHTPDLPAERARIHAAGGRVFATTFDDGEVGPPRVYLGGADIPGLAMSRSLGDAVVHAVGVLSAPQTHVVELCEAHALLVGAWDGLW